MGKLTVTSFISLDGVMQAPGAPQEDTSGGFSHGGWVVPFFDEDFGLFIDSIFARADAFLLGRGTYEIFAGYWPNVTDPAEPVATALNTLPKFVASKTLVEAAWNGTTIVRDPAAEVPQIVARHERELQVHGSPGLIQTLLAQNLVDELNLLIFPVVLGTGKRLFGSGTIPAAFENTGARVTTKGTTLMTLRRTGVPTYGTVGEEPAQQ